MDYSAELTKVLGSNQTLALILLIGVNVVLGVLAALKDGKFEAAELAAILKKVGIYGGTYLGLNLTSEGMSGLASVMAEVGTWLAFLPFGASSLKDVRELGVPLEKVAGKAVVNALAPKRSEVPVASSGVPAIDELNNIFRRWRSGTLQLAEARAAVEDWRARHPEAAGVVPAGWPGEPM